jgi:hypothetical protein
MKGISQWIWIVGSILSAVIVFTIVFNQMFLSNRTIIEQRSINQFDEIASNLKNMCWESVGRKAELTVNLGDMVEGVYAAETVHTEYEKEQLINKIILNKNSTGDYLCLKIADKRLSCQHFDCNVSFPFIGYVPEKFSLSALVNSLMGKGKIYTYLLTLWRVPNGIDVYLVETAPTTTTITTSTTIPGATTTTQSTTSTIPTPAGCKPEDLVKLVDSNKMIENIRYLSQNPRPYGSDWNKQTADYIKTTLESYGLNVHFENFGSKGINVVGEIGTGTNVIVVTGGHRDTVSIAPGAIDNAAGTSTAMEAARVLSNCKDLLKNNKLRFVLFDAEEIDGGMVGSEAYAYDHMDVSNEKITTMLNFDCLGDKDASKIEVYRTTIISNELHNSADKCCSTFGLNCDPRSGAGGSSDQVSFSSRGAEVLFAIDNTVCGVCYHQSCDTLDKISSTRIGEAGKLATCILSDLFLK